MSRRILVVALNPALNVTHELASVDWSGVNRPRRVSSRPGGKGVNVARTLHALGADVLLTGLAGGLAGEAVRSALAAAAVPAAWSPIEGETRRTFAVVDAGRGQTALFNEPGPPVGGAEYATFRDRYAAELGRSAAVVLSGSLPPGLPPDTYAELAAAAAAAARPVLLDADGQALRQGLAGRPAVVKPNLAELAGAVGRPLGDANGAAVPAVTAAAAELRDAGARAVVVTLGARGLLAVTGSGTWQAALPTEVAGNPTGAGDAVAAALAHRLVLGRSWAERLRHAAALGAAAAAAPVAGEFRQADYERALGGVRISRLGAG